MFQCKVQKHIFLDSFCVIFHAFHNEKQYRVLHQNKKSFTNAGILCEKFVYITETVHLNEEKASFI